MSDFNDIEYLSYLFTFVYRFRNLGVSGFWFLFFIFVVWGLVGFLDKVILERRVRVLVVGGRIVS